MVVMVFGSSEEDQPWIATDNKLRGSVRTRRDYYVACSPEQQSVTSFRVRSDKRNEVLYVYYISYDLDYLQQTKHLKQNHTDDHLSNIRLHVYSDSNFTACSNTARSIVVYLVYKGPVLLKRNSKRQSILAQNSAKAEHVANQAASMIAMDPSSLQRSRQFRVIYRRLQMAVERHDLYIRKISSHENHADIGTKNWLDQIIRGIHST